MTGRSPSAAGIVTVADGVRLEALWDLPSGAATTVVVLCHPHPLMGGSMRLPLLRTVAAVLAAAGCAVLRFNFRGIGASEGSWGGGEAEADDVGAALAAARLRYPGLPAGLAGWSFGAVVALQWQARVQSEEAYAGIAPGSEHPLAEALPPTHRLAPARRMFVIGDRDQFTSAPELERYSTSIGATTLVVPGSDHLFFGRERFVGEIVAAHLTAGG